MTIKLRLNSSDWHLLMGSGDTVARVGSSTVLKIGQSTSKINEQYEFRTTEIYRLMDNYQKEKILYEKNSEEI